MEVSYHRPIWTISSRVYQGPKPFKVLNCWFEHPVFKSFIEDVRKYNKVRGSYSYVMKQKLMFLKEKLKRWNVEVFRVINLDVKKETKELNILDNDFIHQNQGVGGVLPGKRLEASRKVWTIWQWQESILIHKSRFRRIKDGDAKTKFFNSFMKHRFRKNGILSLNSVLARLTKVDYKRIVLNIISPRGLRKLWKKGLFGGCEL